MSNPVNKEEIVSILANFMHDIEVWQSNVAGTPTEREMIELDKVYDLAVNALDKEYFKNINQAQQELKASQKEPTNAN